MIMVNLWLFMIGLILLTGKMTCYSNYPQLMECKQRQQKIYFRFPNLPTRLKQLLNITLNNSKFFFHFNYKKNNDQLPLKGPHYEILVAESWIRFPKNLTFRILVVEQNKTYEIKHFYYEMNRKYIKNNWRVAWYPENNLRCFKFEIPYMAKVSCEHVQLLFCRSQVLSNSISPTLKINDHHYRIEEETFRQQNCISVNDGECFKCNISVKEATKYEVCVTVKMTLYGKDKWKCENISRICGRGIRTPNGLNDQDQKIFVGMLIAIIILVLCSACCGLLYFHTKVTERKRTSINSSTMTYQEPLYAEVINSPLKPPPIKEYQGKHNYDTADRFNSRLI